MRLPTVVPGLVKAGLKFVEFSRRARDSLAGFPDELFAARGAKIASEPLAKPSLPIRCCKCGPWAAIRRPGAPIWRHCGPGRW